MHGIVAEIGISILAATALGFVFQLFRQPVILGYLVAGARIIHSTIPDMLLKGTDNHSIVATCRTMAPNAGIVACADSVDQIDILKASGANGMLLPYTLIGDHLAQSVADTCREMEV